MRHGPTIAELAAHLTVSHDVIKKRVKRGAYRANYHGLRGRNGRPVLEIDLASLPDSVQAWWVGQPDPATNPVERSCSTPTTVSSYSPPLPSTPKPVEPLPPAARREVDLATLTAGAREEMHARQRAVLAVRDRQAALAAAGLSRARAEAQARAALAAEHGTTPGTLRRWIRLHRAGGLEALAPRYGLAHRGRSTLDEAAQAFLIEQYLSPQQPKMSTVCRRLAAWSVAQGQAVPGEAVVRRFLRALPPAAQLYHRLGPEAWRQQAMPKERRDLNALSPGEWYCGDNRKLDVFVRVKRAGGWKAVRPWLSSWQDLGSRDLVGWLIADYANSTTIAQAAAMAIRTFGAPAHWYYDNGKDFRSGYLSGVHGRRSSRPAAQHGRVRIDEQTAGILRELGSETHLAAPYTPWAKPIERWFGGMLEWERTLPGWCGSTADDRPEKLDHEIKDVMSLLTVDALADQFQEWLAFWRLQVHGELGVAPAARWEGVTRRIPADDALTMLLMEEKRVQVYATGIRLYGRHFWADELAALVGETVTVRIDRTGVGRVLVFRGGRLCCEAVNKPLLHMGATREQLQDAARRKSKARKIVQRFPQIAREALASGSGMDEALRRAVAEAQAPAPPRRAAAAAAGSVVRLITRHDQAAKQATAHARRAMLRPAAPAAPMGPTAEEREAQRIERQYHAARRPILQQITQCQQALAELDVLKSRALETGAVRRLPGLETRADEYRQQITRLEGNLAAVSADDEA